MQLSPEQKEALDAFEANQNLFLTGPGGSGKTELIRQMVKSSQLHGKTVQVCAMTGCAAVLLGCPNTKTVHSWAGIGLGNKETHQIIEKVVKSKYKKIEWNKPDVLIVDEVSMMSAKLFDILDILGRRCRKQMHIPFGGLQVVFSGDFYQLPPIGTHDDPDSCAFCFESIQWAPTFDVTVQLKTIYRQTDCVYAKILNQIRVGKLSKKSYKLLSEKEMFSNAQDKLNEANQSDMQIQPAVLLPRRRNVDMINANKMKELEGERFTYKLSIENSIPIKESEAAELNLFPHSAASIEAEIKHLRSNVMADILLELAIGTQVMCIANIDMEGPNPIVNGSQGIVVDFINGLPFIQFKDGQKRIIGGHTWPSDNVPGLGVKQLPLIHAWAITIHKAQGVTLDMAKIDAGSGIFECGQTYVALSRVRSLDGLYLTKFDPLKIKVNRKVQAFYASLS